MSWQPLFEATTVALATNATLVAWGSVRVLTLNAYKPSSSVGEGDSIGITIPEGNRPPKIVYVKLPNYSNNERIEVQPGGKVQYNGKSTLTNFYAAVVWLVA